MYIHRVNTFFKSAQMTNIPSTEIMGIGNKKTSIPSILYGCKNFTKHDRCVHVHHELPTIPVHLWTSFVIVKLKSAVFLQTIVYTFGFFFLLTKELSGFFSNYCFMPLFVFLLPFRLVVMTCVLNKTQKKKLTTKD